MKTLAEQIACARRELRLRRNVYPKWVDQGRMTQAQAIHEIDSMEAILVTLDKCQALAEVSEEMKQRNLL